MIRGLSFYDQDIKKYSRGIFPSPPACIKEQHHTQYTHMYIIYIQKKTLPLLTWQCRGAMTPIISLSGCRGRVTVSCSAELVEVGDESQ